VRARLAGIAHRQLAVDPTEVLLLHDHLGLPGVRLVAAADMASSCMMAWSHTHCLVADDAVWCPDGTAGPLQAIVDRFALEPDALADHQWFELAVEPPDRRRMGRLRLIGADSPVRSPLPCERDSMHPLVGSERAVLVRKDGARHEIRAQFSRRGVVTADVGLPIEAGDVFERSLPTGDVELYDVSEATLVAVSSSVPALYDCRVRRRTAKAPRLPDTGERDVVGARQRVRTRPEAAVGGVRALFEVDTLFADLRAAVAEQVPAARRKAALGAVAEMQACRGTDAFARAYARFLGVVAEDVDSLRAFMPPLATLAGWSVGTR
jgi:hypothetical protein